MPFNCCTKNQLNNQATVERKLNNKLDNLQKVISIITQADTLLVRVQHDPLLVVNGSRTC